MSPLFFTKRVKTYCFSFALLLYSLSTVPQNSAEQIDFDQHCKKSDAYILHSYTDVSYSKMWGSYKKHVSINRKLVVNNNSGVDKFAFLNLSKFVSNKIKELDVKTLKADGTVIELDSNKVFQRNSKNKIGTINYPIPGVEPGDTIATSYTYTEYIDNDNLMDFVNLYANVPSLNTEYTVKSKLDLTMRYKQYNNFPEPQIIANDTLIYCVFKMENIKGLSENNNTCLPCELPYIYYSLEKDKDDLRKWKDVYNQEFNVITQPFALDYEKSSFYRKWKRKVIGEAKDSTKYYKFKLLHNDILQNIQMEPIKPKELFKSSGFFLKNKRLNPLSVRKLYRQLLEDLEIDYSAVFARSKRAGKIDPYYIRKGEYDHIFFAYNNEQGSLNLLYPHEEYYKYQINEIPTALYNTQAIIVKPYMTKKIKKADKFIGYDFELAEADSVIVNTIKLPGMTANHNYIKQIYFANVDIKEKDAIFNSRFSVSGGLSTDLRSFFEVLDKNKEIGDFYDALAEFEGNESAIQIDSIVSSNLSNTIPFKYSLVANGTLKDVITFLNDTIVSISLDKLIQHNQIESDIESPDLNYYLDYSYTDFTMIILKFPFEYEILGGDYNKIDFKNDLGEYFYDLKTGNNNQLTIQSNYKIIKDIIPKDEFIQLDQLNHLVKKIKNKRLIIKLKSTFNNHN